MTMVRELSAEEFEVYRKRGEALERALAEVEKSGIPNVEHDPMPPVFLKTIEAAQREARYSVAAERPDAVGGDDAEATRLKVLERLL